MRDLVQPFATLRPTVTALGGMAAALWAVDTPIGQFLAADAAFSPGWWLLVAQYQNGTETTFQSWTNLIADFVSPLTVSRVVGNTGNSGLWASGGADLARMNGGAAVNKILPMPMSSIGFTLSNSNAWRWSLGKSQIDAEPYRAWRGPMMMALALGAEPDTATRQRIEGYAHHKCGLVSSLAASHPYKTEAPTL